MLLKVYIMLLEIIKKSKTNKDKGSINDLNTYIEIGRLISSLWGWVKRFL